MASASIPYNFVNGTTANAEEVDANFISLKNFAETALVQVDGSVKAGLPALAEEIIRSLVPVGSINAFAGVVAPAGWLLCDGITSTASYPILAGMVGVTTPDLRGRVPVGMGQGVGLTNRIIKAIGGSETHQLSESEMPAHFHTQPDHQHTAPVSGGAFAEWGNQPVGSGPYTGHFVQEKIISGINGQDPFRGRPAGGDNTGSKGGNSAHNNMQPFVVVNFIIKHD